MYALSIEEKLTNTLVYLSINDVIVKELTLDPESYERLKHELGHRWEERLVTEYGIFKINKYESK